MKAHNGRLLGVLGGMGPLASAAFVRTIYERNLGAREQDAPAVLLYSDPTFPDRTDVLLRGDYQPLLERLTAALRFLTDSGCSKIIICCVTSHHLLPRVPASYRAPVVSLLDVVYGELLRRGRRHLLACTEGTRRLELFQRHPAWGSAREYVVLPDEGDQRSIHDLIYALKRNGDAGEAALTLKGILSKYGVEDFIAGCTELHLLAKHFASSPGRPSAYSCLDPLGVISEELLDRWYGPA